MMTVSKCASGNPAEIIGGAVEEFHLWQRMVVFQGLDGDFGNISRPIALGVRGEAGEDLAGAAADFKDPAAVVLADALDGGVDPLGDLGVKVFRRQPSRR